MRFGIIILFLLSLTPAALGQQYVYYPIFDSNGDDLDFSQTPFFLRVLETQYTDDTTWQENSPEQALANYIDALNQENLEAIIAASDTNLDWYAGQTEEEFLANFIRNRDQEYGGPIDRIEWIKRWDAGDEVIIFARLFSAEKTTLITPLLRLYDGHYRYSFILGNDALRVAARNGFVEINDEIEITPTTNESFNHEVPLFAEESLQQAWLCFDAQALNYSLSTYSEHDAAPDEWNQSLLEVKNTWINAANPETHLEALDGFDPASVEAINSNHIRGEPENPDRLYAAFFPQVLEFGIANENRMYFFGNNDPDAPRRTFGYFSISTHPFMEIDRRGDHAQIIHIAHHTTIYNIFSNDNVKRYIERLPEILRATVPEWQTHN